MELVALVAVCAILFAVVWLTPDEPRPLVTGPSGPGDLTRDERVK